MWGCAAVFAQARMRMARMPSVGASKAEEARARRTVDCDDAEDPFGATAFEADEAGYGVERMARPTGGLGCLRCPVASCPRTLVGLA